MRDNVLGRVADQFARMRMKLYRLTEDVIDLEARLTEARRLDPLDAWVALVERRVEPAGAPAR